MLKIAHRGASGYEPENTIAAFKKAIALGVDMVELDVRSTKDNVVVVFHDHKINKKTDGKGKISDHTYEEIKSTHVLGKHIPTIHDAIASIGNGCKINIELKDTSSIKPVVQLVSEYVEKKGWTYQHFVISSFDSRKLRKVHTLNPHIALSYIISPTIVRQGKTISNCDNIFWSIQMHKRRVSKKLVNLAHKRNFKVFVWTINNKKDAKRIEKMGADGAISDVPDSI
ncbi:MAG: glycerophosphodiester phosphodiesterase [Candidatus Levyibacteriota bacterium]